MSYFSGFRDSIINYLPPPLLIYCMKIFLFRQLLLWGQGEYDKCECIWLRIRFQNLPWTTIVLNSGRIGLAFYEILADIYTSFYIQFFFRHDLANYWTDSVFILELYIPDVVLGYFIYKIKSWDDFYAVLLLLHLPKCYWRNG